MLGGGIIIFGGGIIILGGGTVLFILGGGIDPGG
jgi:hypothetical protein